MMLGRILIGVGVALFAFAFFMNVTVPDPSGEYPAIANNDLMNQRLLIAMAGLGSFLGGFLALILNAMKANRPHT